MFNGVIQYILPNYTATMEINHYVKKSTLITENVLHKEDNWLFILYL